MLFSYLRMGYCYLARSRNYVHYKLQFQGLLPFFLSLKIACCEFQANYCGRRPQPGNRHRPLVQESQYADNPTVLVEAMGARYPSAGIWR